MENESMTATIIYGARDTGRTTLAKEMAERNGSFIEYHSSYFSERVINDTLTFPDCTEDTRTIIIDDCCVLFNYEEFFTMITRGIIVHKQGIAPFHIHPKFIFISNNFPSKSIGLGQSFIRRFNLIYTSKNNLPTAISID